MVVVDLGGGLAVIGEEDPPGVLQEAALVRDGRGEEQGVQWRAIEANPGVRAGRYGEQRRPAGLPREPGEAAARVFAPVPPRRITGSCPSSRRVLAIFSRWLVLNWLWDGTGIRVVDYEFAGYSDLAFDCADLTEHISSRQAGIDDQAWAEIVRLAGLGGGDQRRFEAAQRTCALRWLAVLWKQRDNRTEEFTSQFDRVRRLQSAAAAI